VPLSEHEQRLLDQIERALYAEDPKFASTVRTTDLRSHMRRRVRRAVALMVIGFVMVLFGVQSLPVGVAGFVVMLGGLVLALSASKNLQRGTTLRSVEGAGERGTGRAKGAKKTKTRGQGSAKDRLEERWRRRWDERGGPQ
jgi:hypothetical protein